MLISASSFSTLDAQENEINASKNEAKEIITSIMQSDDFGKTKKTKEFVYIGDKEEETESSWWENFIDALADFLFGDLKSKETNTSWFNFGIFELLIWSAVIVLLIWLINLSLIHI